MKVGEKIPKDVLYCSEQRHKNRLGVNGIFPMWKGVWLGCGDRKMRLDVGRFGLSGSGEDATGPSG